MPFLPQWLESFLLSSRAFAETRMTRISFLHWISLLLTTPRRSLPGPEQVTEQRRHTPLDFVIFISIHYARWKTYPTGESMQLDAVKNDVKYWLDHLDYQHDHEDHRRFYFLLDFEYLYKDKTGKCRLLPRAGEPTRSAILSTLRLATKRGGSGFIYYGGHSNFRAPGTSTIRPQADCFVYKEVEGRRCRAKAAYFITSDGKRIYGKEFYAALLNPFAEIGASSITLILDTCNAEGFIDDFGSLSRVREVKPVTATPTTSGPSSPPFGQLIVVAASRKNEMAGTFANCGALTFFLTQYLRQNFNASAAEVVRYLNAQCQGQPDPTKRQHPQIWSRYALEGPLRL